MGSFPKVMSQNISHVVFSNIIIVRHLIFKSLIHFKLIFMYNDLKCLVSSVCMWCSFRPSLGPYVIPVLSTFCWKSISCRFGFAPRFSLLFHFSVLFLFQHLYYQIIVSSNRFWKQVMSLTFYFPKIALIGQDFVASYEL